MPRPRKSRATTRTAPRSGKPPGPQAPTASSRSGRRGRRARSNGVKGSNGSDTRSIRYAIIGLGYISQIAVLPAFAHAKQNSTLAALVSDDPTKLAKLGRRYGVDLLCGYRDIDKLFTSGAIDAVYIALPNSMHRDFAVRAARAGLHVLCEKPMALTARECDAMIEAAERQRVKLMIAYRLHFEPGTLDILKIAHSGELGDLRFFTSQFSMQVAQDNIRVKREMGGGPIYDVGVYCINAARMVFGAEPVEVFATAVTHDDPRFREVPETVTAVLKFPQKQIASFTCSLGSAARSVYEIVGTKGSITADPGYSMSEGIGYEVRIGSRTRSRQLRKGDHFAPELLYFSDCILKDREPEPSGQEGIADVRVIEALNRSILNGKWVAVDSPRRDRRPTGRQAISKPGIEPPPLVNAAPPHPPK